MTARDYLFTICIALLIAACEPPAEEAPTDHAASCEDCRNLPSGIDCDELGRCWVTHPTWDVSAQAFDWTELQAGIDGGIFEDADPSASGDPCWRYGQPGDYGHVCVVATSCYDLHARPVSEIVETDGDCEDFAGPWTHVISTAFGCYGVFEDYGLAVPLGD
jgi:hypothetical protein